MEWHSPRYNIENVHSEDVASTFILEAVRIMITIWLYNILYNTKISNNAILRTDIRII